MSTKAVLVLFSGGQDSTTVLAWALANFDRVETIGFDYGQKHSIELKQRPIIRDLFQSKFPVWGRRLGPDHLITIDLIRQLATNIPQFDEPRAAAHAFSGKRYIPARNLIMLSMAGSVAFRRSITTIACGVSETEYSGYPDCRRRSLQAVATALNESSGLNFEIACPLMELDKAGVWKLAISLGGEALVEIIREETHTCYEGERNQLYDWGYGCSSCDACKLREKGWRTFKRTG